MKVGEKIEVERTPSGLYAIRQEGKPTFIGSAASTILTLSYSVFGHEALEVPGEVLSSGNPSVGGAGA